MVKNRKKYEYMPLEKFWLQLTKKISVWFAYGLIFQEIFSPELAGFFPNLWASLVGPRQKIVCHRTSEASAL